MTGGRFIISMVHSFFVTKKSSNTEKMCGLVKILTHSHIITLPRAYPTGHSQYEIKLCTTYPVDRINKRCPCTLN